MRRFTLFLAVVLAASSALAASPTLKLVVDDGGNMVVKPVGLPTGTPYSWDTPLPTDKGAYLTLGWIEAGRPKMQRYWLPLGADAVPTPTPEPGPTPNPTPEPKPEPVPTPEPVVKTGKLHVMVVYEKDDLPTMPPSQIAVLYGKATRDYLSSHCDTEAGTPTYRILDKDLPLDKESADWQAVRKRATGKQPPWIIVANDVGGSFEGPLPKDEDAMLALLKKYGGQ